MQEAVYPGASSLYLDMSRFLDHRALQARLQEIVELNRAYKALYGRAYALLAAGTALLPRNETGLWGSAEEEKLAKKAAGIAARELPRQNRTPRTKHRFLSAVSCLGRVSFADDLQGRIYVLDNAFGLGSALLAHLASLAEERGYDTILCHDPLEPEKLEAVLVPEAGLSFLAVEPSETLIAEPYRHLRLDALVDKSVLTSRRAELRRSRRDSALLLDHATETLARAKTLHDALEAVYRPCVDFAGTDALAEEQISLLLKK